MNLRPLKYFCDGPPVYGLNVPAGQYATSGVRLLRTSDIGNDGRLVPEESGVYLDPQAVPSELILHDGDLLFSRSGTLGRSLLFKEQAIQATHAGYLVRFRPGENSFSPYLAYCAQSNLMHDAVGADAVESTIGNFNAEKYANVRLPWWPRGTQCAIADYLDRETGRIGALIAARRRMGELLKEQFRVARIDLVIDRVNKERQEGPEWLGSVPVAWSVKRLKFVAKMLSGHTPNKQIDAYWIDCTIPWITLNDVSRLEAEWRFVDPKNAVNELGLQNSSARILPENAVVLSRDATVGRSALLGRPMAVSQHFVAWVCGPELMPEYLLNVVRGPMQHHFGSLTAGATIATIGMPDLQQLVVPIPPIKEQERIVRQIAAAERLATKTLARVDRQVELLLERRGALITAAVTGQLEISVAA